MDGRGQMTLEVVVMLFLAIVIFSVISQPLSHLSLRSSESIGTSSLAMKAVDTITQKADFVGISGDGAKGHVTVDLREEFKQFDCNAKNINLSFSSFENITVGKNPAVNIGLSLTYIGPNTLSYSRPVDFRIDCSSFPPPPYKNERAEICFENVGGRVWIGDCSDSPLRAIIDTPSNGASFGVGDVVSFSGHATGGTPPYTSYSWNFGDGSSGNGQTANNTYTSEGTYQVNFTVQDSDGNLATDSISVVITTSPPPPPCTDNCPTSPGCNTSNPGGGSIISTNPGDTCCSGNCYTCPVGESWDGSQCVVGCTDNCPTSPGCNTSNPGGGSIISLNPSHSCCSGNCYTCPAGSVWNGTQCDSGSYNVFLYKIICDDESYLPDWGGTADGCIHGVPDASGSGCHTLVPSDVQKFMLDNSEHCYYGEGWGFEYMPDITGVRVPFSPTDSNGITIANIPAVQNRVHIYEVWNNPPGYVPFSNAADVPSSVSAELLCNEDVRRYDNDEHLDSGIVAGETYYCAAFNAVTCGDDIVAGREQCDGTDDSACPGQCQADCTCSNTYDVVASKVVCDDESYLPDWASGDDGCREGVPPDCHNVNANDAQDFVDASGGHCWFESGWVFQYGVASSVPNPGNQASQAEAEAVGWITLPPTDSNGQISFSVPDTSSFFNFREVPQSGYELFSGALWSGGDSVSAEIGCHNDVKNYDNYDELNSVTTGNIYYCIAFNAQICGDGIRVGTEECDGSDDTACPGQCQADCTCCVVTCNPGPNDPGCRWAQPTNSIETGDECCGTDKCYACPPGSVWEEPVISPSAGSCVFT